MAPIGLNGQIIRIKQQPAPTGSGLGSGSGSSGSVAGIASLVTSALASEKGVVAAIKGLKDLKGSTPIEEKLPKLIADPGSSGSEQMDSSIGSDSTASGNGPAAGGWFANLFPPQNSGVQTIEQLFPFFHFDTSGSGTPTDPSPALGGYGHTHLQ